MDCCINEGKHHSAHEHENAKNNKFDTYTVMQIAIIAILAIVLVYNFGKLSSINNGSTSGVATDIGVVSALEVAPSGIPEVYGEKLGVSYDDVSASNLRLAEETIAKLSAYEDSELTDAQMKRYIKIGSSISCEYCCGAQALIFSNGERACGCAHSYAMRGLAKYFLMNHPDVSDGEILNELGKWKVLFFPGVHQQKAAALQANGIDYTDYVNLASNLYRGIENEQSSGGSGSGAMVGGC